MKTPTKRRAGPGRGGYGPGPAATGARFDLASPRRFPRSPRLPSAFSWLRQRRALVYIPPASDARAADAARMVASVLLEEGFDLYAVQAEDDHGRERAVVIGSVRKTAPNWGSFREIAARALRLPVERVPAGDVVVVGGDEQACNR